MNIDDIQEFCNKYKLDLKIINTSKGGNPIHSRLIDEYGNYVLDVYFKHNKQGIKHNMVFNWEKQSWSKIKTLEELHNILGLEVNNLFSDFNI